MSAKLIDGAALAKQLLAELGERVAALRARGCQPGIAVVLVGDNPASAVYVRSKQRACEAAGLNGRDIRLPATLAQDELVAVIDRLNADAAVHGILVQLPLPPHIDAARVLQRIAFAKDVDGFNWRNLGALVDGHPTLVPCTPAGSMLLLERSGVPIAGKHAVVLGRSTIVGKPAALLLIERHATVTLCHSRTPDLTVHTRAADILICAVGRPRMVTADMVKPGAAVIDVGINRLPDGKLCGDVDFEAVAEKAGWITPVPGGVGPMTVAMVVSNAVAAAEKSLAAL